MLYKEANQLYVYMYHLPLDLPPTSTPSHPSKSPQSTELSCLCYIICFTGGSIQIGKHSSTNNSYWHPYQPTWASPDPTTAPFSKTGTSTIFFHSRKFPKQLVWQKRLTPNRHSLTSWHTTWSFSNNEETLVFPVIWGHSHVSHRS